MIRYDTSDCFYQFLKSRQASISNKQLRLLLSE